LDFANVAFQWPLYLVYISSNSHYVFCFLPKLPSNGHCVWFILPKFPSPGHCVLFFCCAVFFRRLLCFLLPKCFPIATVPRFCR
jgi:hypothetical protein